MLENVKVLAPGARWGVDYTMGTDMGGRAYTTVTLELTPEQVEIVSFAAQKGRLSLSLRNYQDNRTMPVRQSVDFYTLKDLAAGAAR